MAEERNYGERNETISFAEILSSLRRQGKAITLTIACTGIVVATGLLAFYLFAPAERIASIEFRLEFQGAGAKTYPSGVGFSTADIVAGPILRSVYNRNDLGRFTTFGEFSDSIFVIEENAELVELRDEYRARLADPTLSPIDRAQLEQEFDTKTESLNRNSFTVNYAGGAGGVQIPHAILQKTLRDILQTWADFATEEKGAFRYQLPVLTIDVLPPTDEEPIVAIDMLRARVWEIMRAIGRLRKVPGAEALRSSQGVSLRELEIRLDDVIRLYIRPLINEFRAGRFAGDRESAIQFIESQLDHVKIQTDEGEARVNALKNALSIYTEGSRTEPVEELRGQELAGETVMPQFSDSFLDRIVEMAGQASDVKYRQNLVDRIESESLKLVPYEMEVRFYEQLLDDLRETPPSRPRTGSASTSRSIEAARERVQDALMQANEIYNLASENLNASRELYQVTGPIQFSTVRSVSFVRLFLIGVLLLLLSTGLTMILAVVLDRGEAGGGRTDSGTI